MPHKAAYHRNQHCHASSRREEVLRRESKHLGQVAHGGLTAVALPVRVSGEAGCGVEGRIGVHCSQVLRVEWQDRLETLESIQRQQAHYTEEQQGKGVGLPVHLVIGAQPHDAVDEALDRSHDTTDQRTLT